MANALVPLITPPYVAPILDGFLHGVVSGVPLSSARLEIGTRSAMNTAKRVKRMGISQGLKSTARLEMCGKGIFMARRMKRTYELLKTQAGGQVGGRPSLETRAACGAASGVLSWVTMCFSDVLFAGNTRFKAITFTPTGAAKAGLLAAASLPLYDYFRPSVDGG